MSNSIVDSTSTLPSPPPFPLSAASTTPQHLAGPPSAASPPSRVPKASGSQARHRSQRATVAQRQVPPTLSLLRRAGAGIRFIPQLHQLQLRCNKPFEEELVRGVPKSRPRRHSLCPADLLHCSCDAACTKSSGGAARGKNGFQTVTVSCVRTIYLCSIQKFHTEIHSVIVGCILCSALLNH